MAGEMTDEAAYLKALAAEVDAQFERAAARMWDLSGIPEHDTVTVQCWGPTVLTGTQPCPSCGPGRCDGTTQDCTQASYYANPKNGPRPSASGGTAQNPTPAYGWLWPGYTPSYPATRYDDAHVPTERLPAVAPKCECGSGTSVRSGAHSHWCPCWVAP